MNKIHKILIIFTITLYPDFSTGQTTNKARKNTLIITNHYKEKLDTIDQLLIVYNQKPSESKAVLTAMEKKNGKWKTKFKPFAAGIGRNGFARFNAKIEGDGKTPTGLFLLGQLFCYQNKVNSKLAFIQTTIDDKWIDDPESPDYNQYIRGATNAKSYENLLLQSNVYKYCMVIEYNTNPVIKGKGSAIFFHLGDKIPGSTAGCVAISEKNMCKILKWLKPNQNEAILMGNFDELIKGF